MKILLTAIAILFLIGCEPVLERAKTITQRIIYVQDKNTDLCFAVYAPVASKMGFTYVPCSGKVLNEIRRIEK